MWAVGRLSLLSKGLNAVKTATPVPKPRVKEAAALGAPRIEPAPIEPSVPGPDPISPPPAVEPLPAGLLGRIVTRVKGFFRSLFG